MINNMEGDEEEDFDEEAERKKLALRMKKEQAELK